MPSYIIAYGARSLKPEMILAEPDFLDANSPQEAQAKARQRAKKEFPEADGWVAWVGTARLAPSVKPAPLAPVVSEVKTNSMFAPKNTGGS